MVLNGHLRTSLWGAPPVVDIMRVNVDKVLERDQKLSELDDRADALQAGASQFETSAAKLKRKYWWKNCKMWAIGISVVVIIVIIIIGESRRAEPTARVPHVHGGSEPESPELLALSRDCCFIKGFLLLLLFFPSLGPHLQRMEVPGLGVQWELPRPAYTTATAARDPSRICDLHHSSQKPRILNPLSKVRDRTGILMDPCRVLIC
uniref:Vesicle associated membrane protein 3 n=1 Tax=Sus scrofa TaxID=9823 RepID=A0A8W4FEA8_PIG